MLTFDSQRIYLACGHTDMRKSINGLAEIVQSSFELDPFEHAAFAFCNRRRDQIKILEWDTDGFWVHFKRLERGRFRWPSVITDEATMELTSVELSCLIGSAKLEKKLRRNEVWQRKVS